MESFRVAGEGRGEPVEPPKKKHASQSPEQKERKAKTDAVFKIRTQITEEDKAIRRDKRQYKKEVSPRSNKLIKAPSGPKAPVDQNSDTFKRLGRDPVQKILGLLSKKDQQSSRVERFMNEQVIEKVRGKNLSLFNRLTECIIQNLQDPELKEKFKIPKHLLDALQNRANLDAYPQVLYDARSHLVDLLATLDVDTLNSLEAAFKNTKFEFPEKFENIFSLARMAGEGEDPALLDRLDRFREMHEFYEAMRWIHAVSSTEHKAFKVQVILRPNIQNIDSPTLRLIVDECYSLPDSLDKNSALFMAHLAAGIRQISVGSNEKSFDSITKAIEYMQKPLRFSKEDAIADFLLTNLESVMSSSEIDNKTAGKIFAALKHEINSLPASDRKQELITDYYGLQLGIYAKKGFAELQIATNDCLAYLEGLADPDNKASDCASITNKVDIISEQEIVGINRLIMAVKATKDSDAKFAILARLYNDVSYAPNPNLIPDSLKGDAIQTLNKIKDPVFREAVRGYHNIQ